MCAAGIVLIEKSINVQYSFNNKGMVTQGELRLIHKVRFFLYVSVR